MWINGGMKVRVTKRYKVAYISIQEIGNTKNTKNILLHWGQNGNYTKRGRLDQNQRATIFVMHSEFRYHSENCRHRENLNFRYAQ